MARTKKPEKEGGEFFYLDENGKKSDAALHEEMLNIGPEAEARLLNEARQRAREGGMSEEVIRDLYPDT